ncbi:hypothetical protein R1sor_005851 [Riccia sorocarpa]|uniref:Replitron HUH endonuclease domain-containing protein n=1 Tax=Riccia sorocarpa TaxID=122646 RepID=A0ABD3HPK5_9MARC
MTISIAGSDVSGEIFDKLANYMDDQATMGIMAFQRGDAHLQLHIQGMMSTQTTSTRKLKQNIKAAIGWDVRAPVGSSVCIKSLRDQGLHTIICLIGYCLKDEKQEHFRMHCKNVTVRQMEEGRRMHAIHGASEFKNRVQLTPTNVLARALQFRKYQPPSKRYMNSSHATELMIADARERNTTIATGKKSHRKPEPENLTPHYNNYHDHKHNDNLEESTKPAYVKVSENYDHKPATGTKKEAKVETNGNDDDETAANAETQKRTFYQVAVDVIDPNVVKIQEMIDEGADPDTIADDLLAAGYNVMRKRKIFVDKAALLRRIK